MYKSTSWAVQSWTSIRYLCTAHFIAIEDEIQANFSYSQDYAVISDKELCLWISCLKTLQWTHVPIVTKHLRNCDVRSKTNHVACLLDTFWWFVTMPLQRNIYSRDLRLGTIRLSKTSHQAIRSDILPAVSLRQRGQGSRWNVVFVADGIFPWRSDEAPGVLLCQVSQQWQFYVDLILR